MAKATPPTHAQEQPNHRLCERVEDGLGREGQAEKIQPARKPIEMKPSPALSLILKAPKTLQGRKIGVLVTDGTDAALVASLRTAVEKAGAQLQVVAPKIGGAAAKGGKRIEADHQLAGGPSILFDAVAVAPSTAGAAMLENEAAAIDGLRDAFGHLKVIGTVAAAGPLLERAGIQADAGVVAVDSAQGIGAFITAAKNHRIWDREPTLRTPK